jgi:hypothetical protein
MASTLYYPRRGRALRCAKGFISTARDFSFAIDCDCHLCIEYHWRHIVSLYRVRYTSNSTSDWKQRYRTSTVIRKLQDMCNGKRFITGNPLLIDEKKWCTYVQKDISDLSCQIYIRPVGGSSFHTDYSDIFTVSLVNCSDIRIKLTYPWLLEFLNTSVHEHGVLPLQ